MTSDERDEVVLRARAAARAGRSIASNPYDQKAQPELWSLWRLVFADAAAETD